MDSDRERQITSIFHSALAREAGERSAYLDAACGGNDDLRRELDALIRSHENAGSLLNAPAYERNAELLGDEDQADLAGRTLGCALSWSKRTRNCVHRISSPRLDL